MKRSVLPLVLFFAVLIAASVASADTFQTLDAPFTTQGTSAYGVYGNNVVGLAYASSAGGGGGGFLYNGTSYTLLNDPSATNGTVAAGIDGANIVGYYSPGVQIDGFLYNGATWTTLQDPLAAQGTFPSGISGANMGGFTRTRPRSTTAFFTTAWVTRR